MFHKFKRPKTPVRVRCTHCRMRFVYDPGKPAPCANCQSQLAIYEGHPIMVARPSHGLPLNRLDPKKKKFLIPPLH